MTLQRATAFLPTESRKRSCDDQEGCQALGMVISFYPLRAESGLATPYIPIPCTAGLSEDELANHNSF